MRVYLTPVAHKRSLHANQRVFIRRCGSDALEESHYQKTIPTSALVYERSLLLALHFGTETVSHRWQSSRDLDAIFKFLHKFS